MDFIIKQVELDGEIRDILIKGDRVAKISHSIQLTDKEINVIDGQNHIAFPGFINTHTHAAMVLMRGYGDDKPLECWLKDYIWPMEVKLNSDDIYWGTKMAAVEMLKSGTTTFFDMYWFLESAVKAVKETGIRAFLSSVLIDFFDKEKFENCKKTIQNELKIMQEISSPRIYHSLCAHSIYTVSEDLLRWGADLARETGMTLQIHMNETEGEVEECLKNYNCRPFEYIEKIGFLRDNRVIAAHCIHLNDNELNIIKENNVFISHNPVSNLKLSSGIFDYEKIRNRGIGLSIGTDGCSSNNNLDILEEVKVASIIAKAKNANCEVFPAVEAYNAITKGGADALGIDAGVIKEGAKADLILIRKDNCQMVPGFNRVSDLIYSANSSAIDMVFCDGKLVIKEGNIFDDERTIAKEVIKRAYLLKKRVK